MKNEEQELEETIRIGRAANQLHTRKIKNAKMTLLKALFCTEHGFCISDRNSLLFSEIHAVIGGLCNQTRQDSSSCPEVQCFNKRLR